MSGKATAKRSQIFQKDDSNHINQSTHEWLRQKSIILDLNSIEMHEHEGEGPLKAH